MDEWKRASIRELKDRGYSYRTIAETLDLTVRQVQYALEHDSEEKEARCLQCGRPLIQVPHHRKKKFCGDTCRMRWWNSHLDQVDRQAYYLMTCQECGKEFYSYGNQKRKFCSRHCSAENRKHR